jgi:alpha-mannosidase
MPTQAEWLRRIDRFMELLAGRLYSPSAEIPLEISCTFEEVPLERMGSLPFEPAPIGTSWGRKWEYAWFRGTLPDLQAVGGKTSFPLAEAALRPGTGKDSVVYVDGVPCGAIDRFHDTIDLGALVISGAAPTLHPGAEIAILTYAGHGDRNGHVGPVPPDTVTVAPVSGEQRIVGLTTVGRFHEARYQLLMDVRTLHEAYDALPKETLRSEDLFDALCRFTMEVDLEKDGESLDASCRACREVLAPVFACRNGDTTPLLTAFGHSHLDVAWKWPLAETRRKMERTLSNQFSLMARYPEYRYLQSQPYLMEFIRDGFPDLFVRLAEAVASGQVMPEGGMYVEADTNLTGGESLVRQFLYGKRFLREVFGVESRLLRGKLLGFIRDVECEEPVIRPAAPGDEPHVDSPGTDRRTPP